MTDHKTYALADAIGSLTSGTRYEMAEQVREFLRKRGYFIAFSPGITGDDVKAEALDELQRLGQEHDNHD